MKKLVFLLVCLFTLQTVARADDDKPIQVTQMPQPVSYTHLDVYKRQV